VSVLHTVTHCSTLQHSSSTLQHTAAHCTTLQHLSSTLQHTATLATPTDQRQRHPAYIKGKRNLNTLQHLRARPQIELHTSTHCSTLKRLSSILQHTATHCNTLQHSRARPQTELHTAVMGCLHTLQHTATHCNTLQHTATHERQTLKRLSTCSLF